MEKGISLCIVAKNEEKNLPDFFKSTKDYVDEIIFVDTGSADKSIEIARENNCKIFNFEQGKNWIIGARNLSLDKASKSWILVLDPDERINSRDFNKLRELMREEKYTGYYLIQRQYTNKIGTVGWISSKGDRYEESKIANGWHENPILRFFKNDKRIRYEGMPHDLVDKSVKQIGKVCLTDIPIHHFGEMNRDEYNKNERNIEFLKKSLEKENKERFYILFQLASEYIYKKDFDNAIKYLKESVELNPDYYLSLVNLAGIYIKLKKYDDAEKVLIKALKIEQTADGYNNLGIVYSEKNELNRAIRKFEKAIELNPSSADANYNLGLVYLKKAEDKRAIEYFEKAIELNPEYKKIVNIG